MDITVYLADDDQDDRSIFKECVEVINTPAKLFVFKDGEDLMQHLKAPPILPDLIFLDINMPRKNGRECLCEIKKDPRFTETPVIMFTTSQDEQDQEFASQNGADLFVQKPASFRQQIHIIQEIFMLYITNELKKFSKEHFCLTV